MMVCGGSMIDIFNWVSVTAQLPGEDKNYMIALVGPWFGTQSLHDPEKRRLKLN